MIPDYSVQAFTSLPAVWKSLTEDQILSRLQNLILQPATYMSSSPVSKKGTLPNFSIQVIPLWSANCTTIWLADKQYTGALYPDAFPNDFTSVVFVVISLLDWVHATPWFLKLKIICPLLTNNSCWLDVFGLFWTKCFTLLHHLHFWRRSMWRCTQFITSANIPKLGAVW